MRCRILLHPVLKGRIHRVGEGRGQVVQVRFFVHFIFKKTNSGATAKTDEHQARLIDDQEKKPQQQEARRYQCRALGPPLENRDFRRENTSQ